MNIGQTLLITPLFESLKFFTLTVGNFGIAIIVVTVIVRLLLTPLTLPMMRSQKKIQKLKPEMDALKKKHKGDPKSLQVAQMELYKKNNINVLSGCLPQILQIIVLIAFYNVLNTFVSEATKQGFSINTIFFGMDLSKPDPTHIFPILAALTQLVLSLMLLPGKERHDLIPENVKGKKLKEANKEETQSHEMAETMQRQMVFMMPVMTAFIAWNFPAGLGLYWIATTVFSLIQQWMVSGPGGLKDIPHYLKRLKK
jgi:YidC/Oxa1 family membrane protein insertase